MGFPMTIRLRPITPEASGFAVLEAESLRHGFKMLERLARDWNSGKHRFDQPGEMLAGAFADGRLVGVGGRSIDPYENDPRIGRVRHVYVTEDLRGSGIGRLLVENIPRDTACHFTRLNLRAPPAVFGFYERLGFERIKGRQTVTHHLTLKKKATVSGRLQSPAFFPRKASRDEG